VADIISHTDSPAGDPLDRLDEVEPSHRIVGRNRTKADVLFYDVDGRRIALKTYAPRGALVCRTLGRWLVAREAAAYRAAGAVDGLPAFLGRPRPWAIATAWVDAEPLKHRRPEDLDDGVFERLGAIVASLHGRGVALADLHHRDVLLAEDGALWVVDLATAWVLGERPGPLRRALFERFCESDLVNLARMRARFTGGDEAEAVASVSPKAAAWHRRGRWLKSVLDRLRGRRRG
jgi:hypothetical protein